MQLREGQPSAWLRPVAGSAPPKGVSGDKIQQVCFALVPGSHPPPPLPSPPHTPAPAFTSQTLSDRPGRGRPEATREHCDTRPGGFCGFAVISHHTDTGTDEGQQTGERRHGQGAAREKGQGHESPVCMSFPPVSVSSLCVLCSHSHGGAAALSGALLREGCV